MDYFELVKLLDNHPSASKQRIRKWFRQEAERQAGKYLYLKGRKAPRFPVPAIRVDFEFVYDISQHCCALAMITHEAGDAD